jgi:hypothetical protein
VTVKWMFLIGVTPALLAGGCHSPRAIQTGPVDVIVEDGKAFPDDIAGRWKADTDGWELVFAPDGQIVSAVISLGRVRVVPGRTATVPTKSGGEGVFTPGRWTVHYAPDSDQLTVRIVMDRVRVEMGDTTIEGSGTDVFAGAIRPAEGAWQTQWTTFTHYTGRAPGRPPFDLSTDPTYGETKPLTFRKAADH